MSCAGTGRGLGFPTGSRARWRDAFLNHDLRIDTPLQTFEWTKFNTPSIVLVISVRYCIFPSTNMCQYLLRLQRIVLCYYARLGFSCPPGSCCVQTCELVACLPHNPPHPVFSSNTSSLGIWTRQFVRHAYLFLARLRK